MPRDRARAAYRRLLGLYPRRFRERFGESMEQTFADLRRERSGRMFLVGAFVETSLGAAREHVAALSRRRLAPHHRSAVVGVLLFLPIGIVIPAIWLDIGIVRDLLTLDRDRPNALGWTVIAGGLLLLPVAFVVALVPMLRRGPDRRRRLYAVNLLVCAVIAAPMATTLYGLGEEFYRCDIRGIPNCD
jgi:hypothetical protein